MGILVCVLLFMMFQRVRLDDHRAIEWLNILIHQTNLEFKYSQIVTFINESDGVDIKLRNSIIERLVRQVPSLVVDLQKLDGHGENRLFELDVFEYPRSKALYVIFFNEDGSTLPYKPVKNILEIIARLSPVPTRPRCLVVLFNNGRNASGPDYDSLSKILLSAWALKFLDFTIIKVSERKDAQKIILYYYNPFTKVTHSENLYNHSVIFPDKLIDMNRHPFKVPVYNYPSLMKLKKGTNNKRPQIDKFEDTYLYIFSKKLNFAPKLYLQELLPSDATFFQVIFKSFRKGDLNMMATQFLVGANLFNNSVVLGRMHSQTRFTIIAPVLPIEKTELPSDVIIYLALFPSIVIIYGLVVRVMNLANGEWRLECITRALLGIQKKRMPKTLTQRVLYLNLLLLSVKYSSDAFSRLTDVKCIKGIRSFDTAEEILKPGFYVYIPPFVQRQSYNDTTEFVRMIKPRLKIMSHVECVKKLIQKKDRFCLAPDPTSQFLVDAAYAKYKKQIIMLTKATDLSDYLAFTYETGSPYVEKFDKIMQRLIEAGIEENYIKYVDRKFHKLDEEEDEDKNLLARQLYVLLTVCYTICILVFVREVSDTSQKSRMSSRRRSIIPKLPFHCS